MELNSQPSPPVVGNNLLVITVKDGDKPLTGAGVNVHIDMTNMPMPADAKATPGTQSRGVRGDDQSLDGRKLDGGCQREQMAGMKMDGDGTAHFLVDTGKSLTAKGGTSRPLVHALCRCWSSARR